MPNLQRYRRQLRAIARGRLMDRDHVQRMHDRALRRIPVINVVVIEDAGSDVTFLRPGYAALGDGRDCSACGGAGYTERGQGVFAVTAICWDCGGRGRQPEPPTEPIWQQQVLTGSWHCSECGLGQAPIPRPGDVYACGNCGTHHGTVDGRVVRV